MYLLTLYLLIALGFSFLCSIAEAVLLSVTPSYIASLMEKSPRGALRLSAMKENIDRPLAAILSLNTIAHTVGAAGVGAQAVEVFGSAYVGVISAVLTLLILVLSEIIPKTLGATHWRLLARPTATLIIVLIWLLYPLVLLAELITKLLSPRNRTEKITREEFAALADLGAAEGHLQADESRILKNLLRFRTLRVADIMTPRSVVVSWPQELTVAEALSQQRELSFSRIPVYGKGPDDVTGFVLKMDLLLAQANEKSGSPLSGHRRPALAIRDTALLSELFELLLGNRAHIAMVVDRYGSLVGVVTLEDLLETLLGLEIIDEADADADMQKVAREHWRKRAARLGLKVEATDAAAEQTPPATTEDANPPDENSAR